MANCVVCNRPLKQSTSILRNMGPVCSKKFRSALGETGTMGKDWMPSINEETKPILDELKHKKLQLEKVELPKRETAIKHEVDSIRKSFQPKANYEAIWQGTEIEVREGKMSVYGTKIQSTEDLAAMFSDLADEDREKAFVVCCDEEGAVIGTQCVHIGTIDASIMSPKDMLKAPLALGADHFYILHNHPSGHSKPSEEDINITAKIQDVSSIIGLNFKGHAVIGDNYSFILPSGTLAKTEKSYEKKEESNEIRAVETKQKRKEHGAQITDPNSLRTFADGLGGDPKMSYIIAVNTKNEVVSASPLRETTSNKEIVSALIMSNASNAFMVLGEKTSDEMKYKASDVTEISKLLGVKILDVLKGKRSKARDGRI